MSSNPPPPHKALGRDFFVVGAGLAPNSDHPNTNITSVINSTIHKTQAESPTRVVSISDWLVKTLQNAPQFVLRIVRRALPRGDGCCLLDFGTRQMIVLVGGIQTVPSELVQINISVKIAAVDDDSDHTAITCNLSDSIWEHVVVAIDQNGSERATRIFILTETMGTTTEESVSPNALAARIRSKGKDKDVLLDRMDNYASLVEALGEVQGNQSNKRSSTTSEPKPPKKNKNKNISEPVETESEQPVDDDTTAKDKVKSTTATESSTSEAASAMDEAAVIIMPKAATGKRKKDPNQPKKAQSSYNYFFAERMIESKKEHPDDDQLAHSKRVAAEWKALSKEDKVKYEALSAKDHERYRMAMENYIPSAVASDEEPETGKKKKQKKDPDAPKKPMSAYLAFCNDVRPRLQQSHPGISFGELTKMVSAAWKTLTPEDKQKFDKIAKEAKDDYDRKKSAYAATKPDDPLAAATVAQPARDTSVSKLTGEIIVPLPKKSKESAEMSLQVKKAAKSPSKSNNADQDDGSAASESSASTVGEDSDSSTDSESSAAANQKDVLKRKDDGLVANDDTTEEDEEKTSAAKQQGIAVSPKAAKKKGSKMDKAPETPKRSPRNKNKTTGASASKASKTHESAKKGRKSEAEKKERKAKKGSK